MQGAVLPTSQKDAQRNYLLWRQKTQQPARRVKSNRVNTNEGISETGFQLSGTTSVSFLPFLRSRKEVGKAGERRGGEGRG